MSYQQDMEMCRKFIIDNLKEELTPNTLAKMCNYSYYHFCHVFKIWFGESVGEYLRSRRLIAAADMLVQGNKISEVSLDCGFDTPSGFNKAFKRKYKMSPTQYRKKCISEKERGLLSMNVRFESKELIKAVGYLIPPKGDGRVNMKEAGAFWQGADFSAVSAEEYAKVAGENDEIGLWIHPDDKNGDLSYFFGAVVEEFGAIPNGLAKLEMPKAEYAVFTTKPVNLKTDWQSYADVIRACWKEVFESWFDNQTKYDYDQEKYCFELYSSKNGDLGSEAATVDLYVPVKTK